MVFRTLSSLLLVIALPLFPQGWNFHVPDDNGAIHSNSDWQKGAATVLFFLGTDCPISNRYAPEIERIVREYSAKGVVFEIVYSDPGLKRADVEEHDHEFSLNMPALLDRGQVLASRMKVTITPTAVVLSRSGEVLYSGRIDDRYIDLATFRDVPQRRDLRLALDSVLSGKAVTTASTQAVGCFLPPPRRMP